VCAVRGTADVKELEKEGHHIVVQRKEGVGTTAGGQAIQRRARTQTRQLILTVGHREIGSKNGVVSVYVRCIERDGFLHVFMIQKHTHHIMLHIPELNHGYEVSQ
jgi:hypothetical protein